VCYQQDVTAVLTVDPLKPDPEAIAAAAARLRAGGLVAFPTETVYGLGAHALDVGAVRRVFDAKGRPSTDPLIVHVTSLAQVGDLVAQIPDAARELAARFWPGPLTLVLEKSSRVPDEVTAGRDTVAIRVPAHPVARALLEAAQIPVAAPSANLFSRPSPTRASHVIDDLGGRIDVVIDGGPTQVGVESTVLDLAHGAPVILRPGAITLEMLRERLPDVTLAAPTRTDAAHGQISPGLLEKHYSPRVPLTLYEGPSAAAAILLDAAEAMRAGQRVGLLLADDDPGGPEGPALDDHDRATLDRATIAYVGSTRAIADVASNLYAALRRLDTNDLDVILARGFPGEDGLTTAVRDRLRRAAAGRLATS
jgi:L-threonylcarbamoyladenylate synthase